MKRPTILLLLALAAAGSVAAADTALGRYSIEVELRPAAEPAGAFVATALVTELATGEVVAAPRILFSRGEEGRIQSGSRDGLLVEMAIGVDEAGESASYVAEPRQAGELIHAQRVKVRLAGTDATP